MSDMSDLDLIEFWLPDDDAPEAREALARIRAAEWRDISTAPRDGTTVLLFSNKNGLGWNITGYGRWEGGDDIVSGWVSFGMIEPGGNLGLANPTHWMPLPAAPRDGRD